MKIPDLSLVVVPSRLQPLPVGAKGMPLQPCVVRVDERVDPVFKELPCSSSHDRVSAVELHGFLVIGPLSGLSLQPVQLTLFRAAMLRPNLIDYITNHRPIVLVLQHALYKRELILLVYSVDLNLGRSKNNR